MFYLIDPFVTSLFENLVKCPVKGTLYWGLWGSDVDPFGGN